MTKSELIAPTSIVAAVGGSRSGEYTKSWPCGTRGSCFAPTSRSIPGTMVAGPKICDPSVSSSHKRQRASTAAYRHRSPMRSPPSARLRSSQF